MDGFLIKVENNKTADTLTVQRELVSVVASVAGQFWEGSPTSKSDPFFELSSFVLSSNNEEDHSIIAKREAH